MIKILPQWELHKIQKSLILDQVWVDLQGKEILLSCGPCRFWLLLSSCEADLLLRLERQQPPPVVAEVVLKELIDLGILLENMVVMFLLLNFKMIFIEMEKN